MLFLATSTWRRVSTLSLSSTIRLDKRRFSKKLIELRSDTFTKPCANMRREMAAAKVGDDVYGEDPSVNQLQKQAATLLGKECALFVPSATMANLICVAGHTRRGDEIILGNQSHIFHSEGGNASVFLSVAMHTLPNQADGSLKVKDIMNAIRMDDLHYPRSSMIALENTHMATGGQVVPQNIVEEISTICKDKNLAFHLDGARIANAAVASQKEICELTKCADTVTLCFSKGLGAPIGAVLAGTEEFIFHAKRARKSLGGGMRQAGIVAAAALYALQNNIPRLAEDHQNAKKLAEGLNAISGIVVNPNEVKTNILFFGVDEKAMSEKKFIQSLQHHGIQFDGGNEGEKSIRAVTHLDVTEDDIDFVCKTVRSILSSC